MLQRGMGVSETMARKRGRLQNTLPSGHLRTFLIFLHELCNNDWEESGDGWQAFAGEDGMAFCRISEDYSLLRSLYC